VWNNNIIIINENNNILLIIMWNINDIINNNMWKYVIMYV